MRAVDRASNMSPSRAFAFEVGPRPADPAQALAAAPPGCPSGALCVYSGRNYSGAQSILRDCNDPYTPCHRVIAAGGALGGFGSWPGVKRARLAAEGLDMTATRVRHFETVRWRARREPRATKPRPFSV